LLRDDSAPIDPTNTLHERSYYFRLDAAKGPYPIVPNFRQWIYPHDRLPLHWQQLVFEANRASSNTTLAPSNLTIALLMRDGSCRLSGCREQLQVAHVVPQSEADWWRVNDMSRYMLAECALEGEDADCEIWNRDRHVRLRFGSIKAE
jgi:hypothetical protein